MSRVTLDFETRSRCDLKTVGAHRYAVDPSTEILMAAVSDEAPDAPTFLWINPRFPVPAKYAGHNPIAEKMLAEADITDSHNVGFEQAITWGTHQRGAASPYAVEPPLDQWRCTAAMARKAGLPSSLEKLGEALNLNTKKDNRGKALIRFFSIPDKKTGQFNEPKDFPEKWEQFCDYCVTDVVVEKQAHRRLKAFELQGLALETFQFDLRMNQFGVPVNVQALRNAQKVIEHVQSEVGAEFVKLTGLNPTQRDAVKDWLAEQGCEMPDMQAETIQERLAWVTERRGQLWEIPRRALELYAKLSFAAIKKVDTMLDWACPDGRMRGVFKYYGAGTGRWSAGGPQVQNAKKATPEIRPMTHAVYGALQTGIDADTIDLLYDDPLEVISCCIRHFIHDPTTDMLDGDYNAIEARIACWLAGQDDAVEEYRREDSAPKARKWEMSRYVLMAAEIYGKEPQAVTADEREVGKRAILGLGYGMGTEKFKRSSWEQYGIRLSDELAERAKVAFRRKHDRIQAYWYVLDDQARSAIATPGQPCGNFVVRTIGGIPFMLFKLPSGRSIAYPHPKIEVPADDPRDQITYWGQLPMSTQWGRIKLYGAKIFENACQGIAADVMAHGAITAEKRGMMPFALIHDQGLALCRNGETGEDFARALGDLPSWARGLPLKVEAKRVKWYSK
jgi:DNA polymerase